VDERVAAVVDRYGPSGARSGGVSPSVRTDPAYGRTTIGGVAKYHPRTVAFCYERGLDLQYGFNDLARIRERLERTGTTVERLSADPPRVRVTTELDGDEAWLELDEDLAVVDSGE
jgi:hypothetical protein